MKMKSAAQKVFNIENRMGANTYVFDNPENLSELRVSNNVGKYLCIFLRMCRLGSRQLFQVAWAVLILMMDLMALDIDGRGDFCVPVAA